MNTHSHSLQLAAFLNSGQLVHVLDQSHAMLMVLNDQRRLIYCTHPVLELAGAGSLNEVLGKLPGEFLHCTNHYDGGCGAGEACCDCGALLGIQDGLAGVAATRECSLSFTGESVLRGRIFDIRVIPLRVNGENMVALSLIDVSEEKQRRMLEQVFLHDIMNTVGSVRGLLQYLRTELSSSGLTLLDSTLPFFDMCVDEISAQQKVLAAENGDLQIRLERFSLHNLLQGLIRVFSEQSLGRGREFVLDFRADTEEMVTDRVIVHRILVNLLKNALEATQAGGTIGIRVRNTSAWWDISISNPGVMPAEVQRNMFRRAFSTKGAGRGLGTHSVRLLCTNYLGGDVWFECDECRGTVFHVRLPRRHKVQIF